MAVRNITDKPKFEELAYRDCPWCSATLAHMNLVWSQRVVRGATATKSWAVLTCPRCAGLVALDLVLDSASDNSTEIADHRRVVSHTQLPEDPQHRYRVEHLPEDVARYFSDAQRVMTAGVPDAAAVQLRRTLEAAAAHKGIRERNLLASIQEMIAQQLVTKDFKGLLNHVRKIGNIGAHHTDETLTNSEVERVLRFTTQILRNLFEVPGELDALRAEEAPEQP